MQKYTQKRNARNKITEIWLVTADGFRQSSAAFSSLELGTKRVCQNTRTTVDRERFVLHFVTRTHLRARFAWRYKLHLVIPAQSVCVWGRVRVRFLCWFVYTKPEPSRWAAGITHPPRNCHDLHLKGGPIGRTRQIPPRVVCAAQRQNKITQDFVDYVQCSGHRR